ncbi:conserved Plasmodium protein, unknown function [Plasmodium gallinaceum]|uniref:Uncharacterized protein n=1 Tax=Plasmodium gallinaceum TaxID=5849 RepID=A0A1J1GM16_PLAGA|nr:conserved Plasmodium protein, unknown function [Plasmodium gallinaceum]CRG93277.1 conserved Plasmodium protein, unknown function [Plasmodium gallinaceum]
MNNSTNIYNYSNNVISSPRESSMLSISSSQNFNNNYKYSNSQNEMVNLILENCVLEWFPFLKDDKNNNMEKDYNLNNEIIKLKNFYKGVKSSEFPLKKLYKTDRSISNLNEDHDDEDIFYNSNSIYMNILSESNTKNDENEIYINKSFIKDNGNETKNYKIDTNEENDLSEKCCFYDCITEQDIEINNNLNTHVRKTDKGDERRETIKIEEFDKVNNDVKEKKKLNFQKFKKEIEEKADNDKIKKDSKKEEKEEQKQYQHLILLKQKEDREKNKKRKEKEESGDEREKEKYKTEERTSFNNSNICMINDPKRNKNIEEKINNKDNIIRNDNENNVENNYSNIEKYKLTNTRKDMNTNEYKKETYINNDPINKERIQYQEYDKRSISSIIEEIINKESKEKNITMELYGNIYLSICMNVLKKDIDYFFSPCQLKNEKLLYEKKKIKEILKLYDKLFYSHFKFVPNKFYKETLRPIYSYYQNLKCNIEGNISNSSFDLKLKKSSSFNNDNEIQTRINNKEYDDIKSIQKGNSNEYSNLGSFSNIINDSHIKKILLDVDGNKDISYLEKDFKYIYKDLVKLKSLLLKKRHYKNILFNYQKNFVHINNRCVKTYRDIYPVEKEYKIYTQIKKETTEIINSINTNYKKYYLNS